MRISHGFNIGINNITKTKIEKWRYNKTRNYKITDMSVLVLFLEQNNIKIQSYDALWFKVLIDSESDLNKLYNLCLIFNT